MKKKEWTGIEVERARQGLEHAAANVLGRMLFAFSSLDSALGLYLVWSNEGRQLEALTNKLDDVGFQKKLDVLKDLVSAKYSGHEAHSSYEQWLIDANDTRTLRNDLVHGRWGIKPTENVVVNVVGLPTSSAQKSTEYTIQELKNALDRMEHLEVRLAHLRKKWPV